MFAILGECEEIGLVGKIGVALAERKLRNEPRIDHDPPRRQMTVEGIRQEQGEQGISARLEPVRGQVPPPVEKVECC